MRNLLRLLLTRDLKALLKDKTSDGWVQLFRYVLVGGGAFLVDFGTYCLLCWINLSYLIAGVISFIIGFLFNFLLSRSMIFSPVDSNTSEVKELILVLIISLVGLLLTELLLYLGAELIGVDYYISKIFASVLVLGWNYAGRKLWIYK